MVKSFKQHIKQPYAVWVVGGAASGKSTVAEKAIAQGLGFELIDVDDPFEKLVKKYKLSFDIKAPTPEERARSKEIEQLRKAGKLPPAQKMTDLKNPEDFLKGKPSTNKASVVARELTKRKQEQGMNSRKNLLFVETGGQIGAIKNKKKQLEEIGYKTFVVLVGIHPELDLNKQSNFDKVAGIVTLRGKKRAGAGGRNLDPKILEKSLKQVEKVKKELLPVFGKNKLIIDTSNDNPTKNISTVKSTIKRFMR